MDTLATAAGLRPIPSCCRPRFRILFSVRWSLGFPPPSAGLHPNDWGGIRFSVASFQDNLVELRSGLSVHLDPRLERHSRLYTFTSPGLDPSWESPAVLSVQRSLRLVAVSKRSSFGCCCNSVWLIRPNQPWNDKLLDIGSPQLEMCLKRQTGKKMGESDLVTNV